MIIHQCDQCRRSGFQDEVKFLAFTGDPREGTMEFELCRPCYEALRKTVSMRPQDLLRL